MKQNGLITGRKQKEVIIPLQLGDGGFYQRTQLIPKGSDKPRATTLTWRDGRGLCEVRHLLNQQGANTEEHRPEVVQTASPPSQAGSSSIWGKDDILLSSLREFKRHKDLNTSCAESSTLPPRRAVPHVQHFSIRWSQMSSVLKTSSHISLRSGCRRTLVCVCVYVMVPGRALCLLDYALRLTYSSV